jgi:CheY-like chemotaxis protein
MLLEEKTMQVAQSYARENVRPIADPDRTEISVLVVDDNADDYKAICRLLSKLDGYVVKTTRASSGLAARSGVATSRYDVLIADYRLGPETGVDVIKSILRQRPAIAPILISGNLSPEVQKAALNAGAIHCMDKDWLNAKTLECAIRTALQAVFWDIEPDQTEDRPRWIH